MKGVIELDDASERWAGRLEERDALALDPRVRDELGLGLDGDDERRLDAALREEAREDEGAHETPRVERQVAQRLTDRLSEPDAGPRRFHRIRHRLSAPGTKCGERRREVCPPEQPARAGVRPEDLDSESSLLAPGETTVEPAGAHRSVRRSASTCSSTACATSTARAVSGTEDRKS